ncbi:MAG TPA: cytochrome c [Candidatus Binatia bacterium]|nr:cytochrome c [Candidatus Binatia bacterium]
MSRILGILAALAFFSAAGPAGAEDAAPQKAQVCAACHGEKGIATQAIYPNLAGQYRNYLEHALREYRSGARKNPIMAAQAASLSDRDMDELARFFSAQAGPLYTPSVHKPGPQQKQSQ